MNDLVNDRWATERFQFFYRLRARAYNIIEEAVPYEPVERKAHVRELTYLTGRKEIERNQLFIAQGGIHCGHCFVVPNHEDIQIHWYQFRCSD